MMHVGHLDDHSSPLAVASFSPFPTRSSDNESLRLARLITDLTNAINQQPPSQP